MAKVAEQARLARTNHVTLAQPQSKACASSQGQVKGVQHQKILIRRFSPAFVDRKADVFIVSRTSWQTASILHVLSLRQAEVRQRPAPSQGQDEEAVILDKGASFRVEKILYQEYLQEPERRTLIQEVWQRALRLANERRAKGQRSLQPKRIVRAQHEEHRGAMDHYSTLRTAVQMLNPTCGLWMTMAG